MIVRLSLSSQNASFPALGQHVTHFILYYTKFCHVVPDTTNNSQDNN